MVCTFLHTRLMVLFLGLPRWAITGKVKPIWILLKQETVSGSGISWAICKPAPRSRQITMPALHYSVFFQARCPSCCSANSVKGLKANVHFLTVTCILSGIVIHRKLVLYINMWKWQGRQVNVNDRILVHSRWCWSVTVRRNAAASLRRNWKECSKTWMSPTQSWKSSGSMFTTLGYSQWHTCTYTERD